MSSAEQSAESLLEELSLVAGPRLAAIKLVRDGPRFVLGSARHVHTKRTVLLSMTRPSFKHGRAQLSAIADMLSACPDVGLGDVIDRFWPDEEPDRWGCLATTWHEDSRSLIDLLVKSEGESTVDLLDGFRQVLVQVDEMHSKGFVHGDISLSNVVVVGYRFHLVDFEYVTTTKFYVDQGDAFFTGLSSQPGRLSALSRGMYDIEDAKAWDRYALGRLAMNILNHANPYLHRTLTLFNQRALRIIAGLLMGSSIEEQDHALGLPKRFFQENGYLDVAAAVGAISRVIDRGMVAGQVPELGQVPPAVVEVGLTQPVAFTNRVRAIVDTPAMQQISTCQQLGLVGFIWPTATHTRLQHALGTFGVACSAVNALFADPQSPFFVVLMDARLCRTFLAAALLHDVGHYPLAHDLEEAFPGPFDHEPRSVSFIESGPIAELLRILEAEGGVGWGVLPADVASIIEGSPRPGSAIGNFVCEMLHSLLSGALDVDKLDYLIRDSRALGVRAGGGIDLQRVISSLTVVLVAEDHTARRMGPGLRLAVRAKGIRPAELVGRVRSHMFGVAYWHHSYRAIKAMIHWLVWAAVLERAGDASISRRGEAVAQLLLEALNPSPPSAEDQITLPGLSDDLPRISGLGDMPGLYKGLDLENRIPAPESAVLEMLDKLGNHTASDMRDLLLGRSWFRAVLTVEHFDNLAVSLTSGGPDEGRRVKRVWDAASRLKNLSGDAQVQSRRDICVAIQTSVRRWFLDNVEEPNITRIVDWPNERDSFIVASEERQLMLVDLVETRKSKDKPLYFVPTERPGSRMVNTASPIPVRRSFDQKQLQQEFVVSNGAIRVLVHPRYDKLVTDSIDQALLLDFLINALEQCLPARTRTRNR